MKKKAKTKIINPTRKRVKGILIALILSYILWVIMLVVNLLSTQEAEAFIAFVAENFGETIKTSVDVRYDGILLTGDEIAYNIEEATNEYYDRLQTKADLSARASYDLVLEQGNSAIGKIGDGAIVKVENGEVTLADGIRTGIREYASVIRDTRGMYEYITPTMNGDRKDTLVFSRIKGSYYYVEIINGYDYLEYLDKYVNFDDVFQGMEEAYEVGLFVICPDKKNSKYFYNLPGDLVYYPGKAADGFILNGYNGADFNIPADSEELMDLNGALVTDDTGETQSYVVKKADSLDCIFLIVTYKFDAVQQAADETMAGVVVILILTITFIIWITSVYKEMTNGLITDKKKEMYSPGRMRLIALSYGILGAIIVFFASVFFRSLNNIYSEITNNQNTLEVIDAQIDSNTDYVEQRESARRSIYMEYGRRLAELIEKNPYLSDKEALAALNKIIGSEYIMLFDSEGREICTSADYIDMELGREDVDNPSSTADFRRILKGVPGIAHSAFKDEVTGRTLEQYGVRITDAKTGKYGVLILAVKPGEAIDKVRSIDLILRSLTPANKFSFVIDPNSYKLLYCMSDEFLDDYSTAEEFGIGKNMIRDDVSDFAIIGGEKHLCVSKTGKDGNIIFLCTSNDVIFSKSFRYGFVCAIGFAVVFALLCLYLLFGYTNEMIDEVEKKEKAEAAEGKAEAAEGKAENVPAGHVSRLSSMIKHVLGKDPPEKKALRAFEIMLGLLFVLIIANMRKSRNQGQLLINYVLTGKWNKGFNIFALTSIVLLFIALLLGMLLVRFIMNTLGKMLNSRGQTICRLVTNLINYVGILVFIYYALSYLGVDTNAILASVGVIGIGVAMGARDLIADIFAGVSMIFEGEYQVGDIVNIDGYRGMVQEVGVRSTRLIGRGGNVKVIGNKDIKSVTNLTKMNSWVAITIKVDVHYSLRDAEEIISEALPRIAQNCKEIISGPYYKGVLSVEMGFAVLSIIAECNEDNFHKVERELTRGVLLALREHNVPVR